MLQEFDQNRHAKNGLRTSISKTGRAFISLLFAAYIIGAIAGLAGMSLALLLHWVQHHAYGYSLGVVISPESFLEGVTSATPSARVIVMCIAGVIAGAGWYLLAKFGHPLVSVSSAVAQQVPMPGCETVFHGLLQMVTVALGSPLGREVAPREFGAMFAQRLSNLLQMPKDTLSLLTACGASAGLAAVYDVPLAAVVFVFEVLGQRLRANAICAAVVSCFTGAAVARLGLGDEPQYLVPVYHVSEPLVFWSLLFGPVVGVAGYAFRIFTAFCKRSSAKGILVVPCCVVAFCAVGVVSIWFPQLLGNGKGPAELALSDRIGLDLAITLIIAKMLALTVVLGAGARGGLLTPGFSIGALFGIILGSTWDMLLPQISLGAVALVGAGAFLSSSMAMPITAIVLTMEFADGGGDLIPPLMIAVAGAWLARHLIEGSRAATKHQIATSEQHTS